MNLEIDHGLRVCEEATGGEWRSRVVPCRQGCCDMFRIEAIVPYPEIAADNRPVATVDGGNAVWLKEGEAEANAAFVCYARTALPKALRRLKRLREILAKPDYQPSYKDGLLGQCEPTIDLAEWSEIQSLLGS